MPRAWASIKEERRRAMDDVIILQLTFQEADELEDLLIEREEHLTDAQDSAYNKISNALDIHEGEVP